MESSNGKKYMQVYEWLRRYIEENKFAENRKLPSENMLQRKLSVSRQTVRHAIARLAEEKLVDRVKGSGTYINKAVSVGEKMRRHDHYRIGVILQGQDTNANAALLSGMHSVFDAADIEPKVFFTDNRFMNERKCLQYIISERFQGVIVDGVKASLLNPNIDCYRELQERGTQVIFYNNYYKDMPFPKVIINDARSADLLMRRLTEAGHHNIAGIFVYDNYQSIEKYKGCIRAMMRYGAEYNDDYLKWCISGEAHDGMFYKQIVRFLKKVPHCTAIVCCNYMILRSVYQALDMMGKRVPQDYSVVCFDYSGDDYNKKGVTCTVHPGFWMGREVSTRMLKMLKEPYTPQGMSCMLDAEVYDGTSIGQPREI